MAPRVVGADRSEGQRPIVIVGTGRCGSTLLHRVLARHDDLGWISSWNEVFPGQPWLAAFSRLYEWRLPAGVKESKPFPKPFEAYRFWEHYLPGFSRRDRPPSAEDVDVAGIGPVRDATATVLDHHGRDRLLVKVTGWSRIAYFDRIYPDARFVSLRRDPRSVVSSWIKAGWLDVTSPPESASWQWGHVPPPYLELWRELGGGPALSVALKIRLDLDDLARNAALFPDRCHELRYEELIEQPRLSLRALCDFAGLPWTRSFADVIGSVGFHDRSEKWQRYLGTDDAKRVLAFIRRSEAVGVTDRVR
ncbi:MAG: sulfotransferase family protein [Solirubrobacterales bacterium]